MRSLSCMYLIRILIRISCRISVTLKVHVRMLSHVLLHMFQIDPDRSDIRLCFSCSHTFTGLLMKCYCVFDLMKHIRAPCCSNVVCLSPKRSCDIIWSQIIRRILFVQDKHPADIRAALNGSLCAMNGCRCVSCLHFQEFLLPFAWFLCSAGREKKD